MKNSGDGAFFVRQLAAELGFFHCGIAKAESLDDDARRLEAWLNKGFHGTMGYMENHFDLRVNPQQLVPGARSVITLLMNYYPGREQDSDVKVARYAWGKDYHKVIRKRLKEFSGRLQEKFGAFEGRGFVDSAPVLERAWAKKSGLGWIGRNGNLIHPKLGSYFFIATLITDLSLPADDVFAKDYCGSCNRCVEACPTQAILPDKVVDGSKCISHFTIELKGALLPANAPADRFGDWIFGCDVCQEVCPWNRFSRPHNETAFEAIPGMLDMKRSDWLELGKERFEEYFAGSPIRRAGWEGMQRNLKLLRYDDDSIQDQGSEI